MTSQPQLVSANGVELCVQTFGAPADPALLLIGGAAASMDWWEDEFCERLASGRRSVIRYDHRDTGQSVSYPPGAPGYTGTDLVADAAGVLHALGIARAHVVGISMGGGIAQHLALDHADRVLSLTLMSTSPAVPRDPGKPDLPPSADTMAFRFAEPPPEPDWSDREAVIDYIVEDARASSGSIPFDEERTRALAARVVDRTVSIASSLKNHSVMDQGEPTRRRLSELAAPTLVLHGTDDPLFPFPHGKALAAEIPGARLLPLPGVGHELPPRPLWDQVVAAILDHSRSAGTG